MHRNGTGMRKGSGSFGGLRMLGSERKSAHSPGRARIKNITLSRSGVDNYRRRGEERLRNGENHEHGDAPNFPEMINVDDFLTGAKQADLSHAGGELGSLEEDIEEDLVVEDHRRGSKREDWRTHRDRTEIRNRAFASQMPDIVSAYIRMCAEQEMPLWPRSENARMDEVYEIQVVDMFRQGYSASLAFGSTGAMCPLEANGSNQGRTVGWFQFKPQGSRGSNQFKQWFKQWMAADMVHQLAGLSVSCLGTRAHPKNEEKRTIGKDLKAQMKVTDFNRLFLEHFFSSGRDNISVVLQVKARNYLGFDVAEESAFV
ncbi:hypothetical protein B0H14DRAFT_2576570 [Mycena olivaceomarginata]|nr:hypothetical protein B0H14DRAFT_2576570 [Mycena olivaceomarginata]